MHSLKRRRWMRMIGLMAITAVFVAPAAVWAADTFTDVPDSNVFHDDIAWLAGAGVTQGCNPPDNTRFCPGDQVTREQMAAFMKRLAENQVVDAGMLGGAEPAAYQTVVAGTGLTPNATLVDSTNQTLQELTLDVGTSGFGAVTAGSSFFNNTDSDQVLVWIQVDDTTCSNGPNVDDVASGYANTDPSWDTVTISGVAAMEAGSHTVTLCGRSSGGAADPVAGDAHIEVVFSSNGSLG